jgi:isopentenyl diphosphate isomerase/L-lactate dehydrogenase-like FMN-dependent dehydrogenase
MDTCINLADIEALARAKLAGSTTWDYYEGGAEDEYTVAENCAAFRRIKLRPRVLVDVAARDLSTEILGQRIALPVLLGPTTYQRLVHPDAEIASARAAAAAGTIFVVPTEGHYSVREIAAAAPGPLWFQLYTFGGREAIARLVQGAEQAGCRALVVTVTAFYEPRRERHLRRPLLLPPEVRLGTLEEAGLVTSGSLEEPAMLPLTWPDIAWLRSITRMPIVLKGIMTGEDAALAVEHGVDGIVVSNHGGRQVDGTLATIEALPEIVERVAGRIEILLDGGIRRGTDVLKVLALGAKAVLIARPYLWGLAASGEEGVRRVLDMLRDEIDGAMAQLGVPAVARVDRSLVIVRSRSDES